MLPAMPLELTLRVTKPPLATLNTGQDPLRVKLEPRLGRCVRLRPLGQLFALVLADKRSLGPAEELAPALPGAQLLGQLITTRLAELLILGGSLDETAVLGVEE
jgi:hypothetical protein